MLKALIKGTLLANPGMSNDMPFWKGTEGLANWGDHPHGKKSMQ